MKKRFFSRYSIKTPNSLLSRLEKAEGKSRIWQLAFGADEMCLHDYGQGIRSDIYLDANDIDDAIHISNTYAENIMGVLDLSTTSPSMAARLDFIYDASPLIKDRDFYQFHYLPADERNIRKIDGDMFDKLFHSMDEYFDGRITRAAQWFKRAQNEEDNITRFIFYWTGLESLNLLLCEHYGISEDDRELKCPKCKHRIFPVTSVGIKRLIIDDIKSPARDFSTIRELRVRLMHGQGKWDRAFLEDVKKFIPTLRTALLTGICMIIHLDADTMRTLLSIKSTKFEDHIQIVLKAKLLEFTPVSIGEFAQQPYIEMITDEVVDRSISTQGKLTLTKHHVFKSINGRFDDKIETKAYRGFNSAIEKFNFV
jgi:hypothetical protein